MNDEIKEILEALDNTACCPYHDDMCKKAKNYITNLQQENEIKTTKLNAIRKYLLNNKLYTFKYDDEELFEITTDKKAKDVLLNILNGGDVE